MPELPEVETPAMITIDRTLLRDVLRGLIACNSINPSLVPGAPGEGQIALYVTTVCRDLGLEAELVEAAHRPFARRRDSGRLGTEALAGTVTADAAIVTEPTALAIGIAHKGFAWVRFETVGGAAPRTGHREGGG